MRSNTNGSMVAVAKEKTSITIDRGKVDEVRRLTGAPTTSAAVDLALRETIRLLKVRNDIEAYLAIPETGEELAIARADHDWSDLADDTDWEALYADPD